MERNLLEKYYKLIKFLSENEYNNLINEYKIRAKWRSVHFNKTEEDKKIDIYVFL